MGLDIYEYHYTYSMLHKIRAFALKVENSPYGSSLDCEGSSLNFESLKGKCNCINHALDGKEMKEVRTLTKFPELIWHSDCDEGYLSFSKFGLTDDSNKSGWGDLDRLKEEIAELKTHREEIKDQLLLEAFDDFCSDVEYSDVILQFK